jgi:transcriptional regulator with XRE-family HTH domain
MEVFMFQTIGKKIAQLRVNHGWTQQYLADRIAISRVAVSHIEMDLTVPGERTITLMAGLFKMTPPELVADTTYPKAKSDRLPLNVCCYTPLELDISLMENDLDWLELIQETPHFDTCKDQILNRWLSKLNDWDSRVFDEFEKAAIQQARQRIRKISTT